MKRNLAVILYRLMMFGETDVLFILWYACYNLFFWSVMFTIEVDYCKTDSFLVMLMNDMIKCYAWNLLPHPILIITVGNIELSWINSHLTGRQDFKV